MKVKVDGNGSHEADTRRVSLGGGRYALLIGNEVIDGNVVTSISLVRDKPSKPHSLEHLAAKKPSVRLTFDSYEAIDQMVAALDDAAESREVAENEAAAQANDGIKAAVLELLNKIFAGTSASQTINGKTRSQWEGELSNPEAVARIFQR